MFCGCCGGPYSLRGADRFACSNHIGKGSYSNSRGSAREDLEHRVLAGLKDRMMAPEIIEDAMRAYAEETNRLNRKRRTNGVSWKAELVKVEKQIAQIVEAIADGMYHPSMKKKMTGLEVRREELTALLAGAPADTPDILPSASSHLREEGRRVDEGPEPEGRAAGSVAGFARPDREDRADSWPGTRGTLRHAAWRT